jgi:hypothetical protein
MSVRDINDSWLRMVWVFVGARGIFVYQLKR